MDPSPPPSLRVAFHSSSSLCGKRAICLGFSRLFAFLFVFGLLEHYYDVSTRRDAAAIHSANMTATPAQLTNEGPSVVVLGTVDDFIDIQNTEIPPLANYSFDKEDSFEGHRRHSISYKNMLQNHSHFRMSPYELRWEDVCLPYWAEKETRKGQSTIPKGKHVCFAHVGKTGGSTLGCSLGFSLHCRNSSMLQGVLPLYTTNVVHNGINDCPDRMPYYLFPVRNPLDRLKSAYVYDRPVNTSDEKRSHHEQFQLYYDCHFWVLNTLAVKGLAKDGNASAICKERAIRTIQGTERHGYHLYFNYRWFVKETYKKNSKILVIRNEHMVEDWNSAEQELSSGASNVTVTNFPHDNPSAWKAMEDDSYLTESARQLLCHYLCDEIQVYKWLLFKAVNLDDNDFVQSMKELRESCPVEAVAKSC